MDNFYIIVICLIPILMLILLITMIKLDMNVSKYYMNRSTLKVYKLYKIDDKTTSTTRYLAINALDPKDDARLYYQSEVKKHLVKLRGFENG